MSSSTDLNPQQEEAVQTTQGSVLILAGAGSGKTRVIIQRIAHLIRVKNISPSQILAVTFTNKAANEMRERLDEMLKGRQKAVQLSTFHALGVRLLRQSIHHLGYRPNFIIYDTQDQLSVIKGIMEDHDFDDSGLVDAKSAHFRISQAKSSGHTPEYFLQEQESPHKQLIGKVFQLYQKTMKDCNAIDFDDILNLTLHLFRDFPEVMDQITEHYRYIMVDEYQDTNRIQYELLRHLTKRHQNLCVVGDDDQSIYGWRGADIRNILDFERDFPQVKIVRLEQNYRSTQVILEAANQVISENTERMPKKLWSNKQGGDKIDWMQAENESEEMESVARQIRRSTLQNGRRYSDYAILYRSNFQSRVVEEALRDAKIPYRVVGSTSFYDRQEIRDALAYLKVIFNPDNEVSLHRIINTPRRGIGKASLAYANQCSQESHLPLFKVMSNARRFDRIPKEVAFSMEMFCSLLQNYQQRFESEPLGKVFFDLIDEIGYLRFLETQSGDEKARERRLANVMELLRGVQKISDQKPETTLQEYLERITLFTENDNDPENDKNQVTLMTLHSAKGLEFPYVFMVGMSEGVFPNKRALDEGGENEERRLCYVGITRAQQELTFSMGKTRQRFKDTIVQEPSRFLMDINPDLLSIPIIGEASEEQKKKMHKESRSAFFSQLKNIKTV